MNTLLTTLSLTIILVALSQGQAFNTKEVAYEGYDVVAYHEAHQAIQGSHRLSVVLDGIHYYFSNTENLLLFKKSPQKYMPKYGGYCAIGVAWHSERYDIDPEDFLIDEGKLYLFCPDQLENWKAKKDSLKIEADLHWSAMMKLEKN